MEKNLLTLSSNISMSMDHKITRRNCNVFYIGSKREREKYIVSNLLQSNASFVVTDYDGVLQKESEKNLKEKGYEVKVLDLCQFKDSAHYNPFRYVYEDIDVCSMANTLAECLFSGQEPFYVDLKRSLLRALIFYIWKEHEPAKQTLQQVSKLLSHPDLDNIFEMLLQKDPEHPALADYITFKKSVPEKEEKAIFIDVGRGLSVFNIHPVADLLSCDDLKLDSIGSKPTALFIALSNADETYNVSLLPVFFEQLFARLYHRAENFRTLRTLPNYVKVFLDEPTYKYVPGLEKILATMHSYNISCDILTSRIYPFKNAYPKNWQNLIANCDVRVLDVGAFDCETIEMLNIRAMKRKFGCLRCFKKEGIFITSRKVKKFKRLKKLPGGTKLVCVRGHIPLMEIK